jgi:DMSO/TMAO reductase YedYZ molybdopterin-dependent catalytic subunit
MDEFSRAGTEMTPYPSRRHFLAKGAVAAAWLCCQRAQLHAAMHPVGPSDGKFIRLVPFVDETDAPFDTRLGEELDARFYTDLSRVPEGRSITPSAEFYVRTGASRLLPAIAGWSVRVEGLVSQPFSFAIEEIRRKARPMGPHLMECAGNVRLTHFGLMSTATWAGVPVSEILEQAGTKPGGSQVLVTGFDDYMGESFTSIPGASWVFPVKELTTAGAFLATAMNGQPLSADHGAPVRLVVPGWYGCACIKWVNNIRLVDDSEEATSQMREYAARTLQDVQPQHAVEYQPATVDTAAIPVRVEEWVLAGKAFYRIVGILWGGTQPVKTLKIRFNPDEDFATIQGFRQTRIDPWTIWTHRWSPREPGRYAIELMVADPPIRTRKMSLGLYVRSVEISHVA